MKQTNLILILLSYILISQCKKEQQPYGAADTNDPKTKIPTSVKPAFDHWMRDTWVTLGEDGYYYMTGTTADPNRTFDGQTHCWDWNDGLYLFRSKDLKVWEDMGLIWSMEKDGTWQKEPKIYTEGEKYPRKSLNGDSGTALHQKPEKLVHRSLYEQFGKRQRLVHPAQHDR